MKPEALHIGMKVRHPQYGVGTVKAITEQSADIAFDTGKRTVAPEPAGLEPAEPQAAITGLDRPMKLIIAEAAEAAVRELGIEKPDSSIVEGLGPRWHRGKMVLHPADATVQTKEVPLESFFHKIVMMRNNFRVLEQKINGHPNLSDGDKVELQQYITRCYGSMTTFNTLFRNREDQFKGGGPSD
ncbi:MAG: hypothetical protein L0Y58_23425 [Verrucomicrobia subdivision 3 bacterium]|nr:hypothetical protein [Limisphaerales bacterium]